MMAQIAAFIFWILAIIAYFTHESFILIATLTILGNSYEIMGLLERKSKC